MQDYFDRMHDLGIRLAGLLATGLGLDPGFFNTFFSEPMSALRLLHYSAEVLYCANPISVLVDLLGGGAISMHK